MCVWLGVTVPVRPLRRSEPGGLEAGLPARQPDTHMARLLRPRVHARQSLECRRTEFTQHSRGGSQYCCLEVSTALEGEVSMVTASILANPTGTYPCKMCGVLWPK